MNLQDEIIKHRQKKIKPYQKEIDKVLEQKTTGSRARAAINLWLKTGSPVKLNDGRTVSPAEANRIHLRELNKIRSQQTKDTAATKDGSWRYGLDILPEAWRFIQLFHPDIFDGTPSEQRTKFRKLLKEFKEYQVPAKV